MGVSILWLILPIGLGVTSAIAYLVMLYITGSSSAADSKTMRMIHRAMGALAVLFYALLIVLSIRQGRQSQGVLSSISMIVLVSASLFIPVLIAKIVIIERYPELRNRLFTLGTVLFIFGLSTSLVALLPKATGSGQELLEIAGESDFVMGRDLFVVKCSKCHRIESVLTAERSPEEWKKTIETMAKKDLTWISETEAARIHKFLSVVASRPKK